ncbi:sensor histidine kinase [Arcobacter sp.]|uniref:sensor histidine kinase n=1 Tax=Arcobacter sp. TaxID=1872629 RepID=UPI003D141DB8
MFKDEKGLLNFIKYGAISSLIIFTMIIIQILIYQKDKELNYEIKKLEENYISHNKVMVQNLVTKIYKLIDLEREFEKKDFDNLIKEEVYQAYGIAKIIYNKNIKKANYSKEKTLDEIIAALRGIRFNNDKGYLFIYEMSGKNILNAGFPNMEGKNLWNFRDSKGTLILQDMNKILSSKDETFYNWYWKKSADDEKEQKKIGFFKKFEPYNLFIGSGYYEKDFNNQTKKRILKKLNSLDLKDPEHFFINDLDGLCLVNPKKELIDKNRIDVKNSYGYTLKEVIKFTKENKEGFIKYNGMVKINDSLKSNEKISFVKLYEDWNWIIGSGFYLENLTYEIKERKSTLLMSNKKSVEDIIIIGLIIIVIIIFLSFYVSRTIDNIFNTYKLKIKDEMNNVIEKEKLLIQQSKMATMGEMIGSIAHQWKQPLSVISMASALLRINREMKDFSSEKELDEAIDDIDESVHNLTQTIDDFRNFFNPNKQKCLFKISEAFEDTLKLINSQLKNNNIEIIKEIEDIEFFGSKNELLQTLINILKNAKEELVKKASSEKRYIFINVYKKDNTLFIKIKDNANGIPFEIIDNIFDAYYTTKEEVGGTGIGLYMSKRIIEESMNGKIEVSNVEYEYEKKAYKGAEFIIKIALK